MTDVTTRTLAASVMLAAVAFGAAPASAAGIDETFARQNARIDHGVATGKLTRAEAFELRSEQRRIGYLIQRARRDGHIDRVERNLIENAQERASRHIFAEKHDGQGRRFGYGYGYGGYGNRWYR